jgi:hypothetical protein
VGTESESDIRAELEKIARDVEVEQERHIRALAELRVREVRAEAAMRALRARGKIGTVGTMNPSRGALISSAKLKFPTAWQAELARRGLSIADWVEAAKKRYGEESVPPVDTVRSWTKRKGKGGRPIPGVWADRLATEFEDGSLADPDSWPAGIR